MSLQSHDTNYDTWLIDGDPFISSLPGMSSPLPFSLTGFFFIFLIKILIPKVVNKKKRIDIKPIAIFANGLAFGTCLAGITIIMFSIPVIKYSLDCHSYKRETNDLVDIAIKYMAYLFIFMKLYDFFRPLLISLKAESVSLLDLIQIQVVLIVTWIGVKTNPGGSWLLTGIFDTMYQGFLHGYLVLTCASRGVKPSFKSRQRIKKYLHLFRAGSVLLVVFHLMYSLLPHDGNDCPNHGLVLFLLFYTILYLIVYAMKTNLI